MIQHTIRMQAYVIITIFIFAYWVLMTCVCYLAIAFDKGKNKAIREGKMDSLRWCEDT